MKDLTFTQVKDIINFCELNGIYDHKEVVDNIVSIEMDFEVSGFRFIHTNEIDQIQQDELSSDEYILGCFNSDFLSGILDIDIDVLIALKEAKAFEAIGKLIISLDKIEELQEEYSSHDGYGHHFAYYDHNEHELIVDGDHYHVFRID